MVAPVELVRSVLTEDWSDDYAASEYWSVNHATELLHGFFSFLEMNDLELVFLETYASFPSNNPKMYPKGDHTRRRQHTQHSTKSRE